jgi:predicted porin
MNKKLLAVAIAGALAAPGLAFAQASSVTISGVLKVGVDNLSISNPNTGPAGVTGRAGKNTSEMRVTDNSSRIIFGMVEDLGNDLAAIGQIDMRFSTDIAAQGYQASSTASGTGPTTFSAGGNTWVGLRSKTMGAVMLGRQDLHYGLYELNGITVKAGALMAATVSLFDYIGQTAIAGGTRTNNVVFYDSPNWSGFQMRAAWSANPTTVETDLVSGNALGTQNTRKGSAWNFNPRYDGSNWGVRYSYWTQKSDVGSTPAALGLAPCSAAQTLAGAATVFVTGCISPPTNPADQRGDTLLGYMTFGGLNVALGYNKSTLTGTDAFNGGAGVKTNDRIAWTLPITYTFGPNNIYFHYTKANDDKVTANGANGAHMYALAYVYELSKRTSVGLTYAKINNNANGTYGFFTNGGGNSLGQFGSPGSTSLAGESPSLISAIVRHAF